MWVQSLGWEDPIEEEVATYSSLLAGKFHEHRSLEGYNPWGFKESDKTEWLSMRVCVCVCARAHTQTHTQTPEFLKSSILESYAIVSEISPLCPEGTRVLSRETETEGISWAWSLGGLRGLRRLRLCWECAGECLLPEALVAWRVIIIPTAWLGLGRGRAVLWLG